MGKPGRGHARSSFTEFIGEGGETGELKHLSTRRESNPTEDSLSSGERTGTSPKRKGSDSFRGWGNSDLGLERISGTVWKGPAHAGE